MTLGLFGGEGRTDEAATLAALEVDYTPPAVAVQLLLTLRENLIRPRRPRALDPAAGSGCWGRALRAVFQSEHIVGVEPRESEAANLAAYDVQHVGTFEEFVAASCGRVAPFDLVATNPPFSAFEAERCWPLSLLESGLLHDESVVAFYGLTQWGQSDAAQVVLRSWSPFMQFRVGGRVAHRGDGKADAREYSLWVWGSRDGRSRPMGSLPGRSRPMGSLPSWVTFQLPTLPAELRRWSPTAIPGTFEIDESLVDDIRRRFL